VGFPRELVNCIEIRGADYPAHPVELGVSTSRPYFAEAAALEARAAEWMNDRTGLASAAFAGTSAT
jgi:hypothetical protein